MTVTMGKPDSEGLRALATALDGWQRDGGAIQLHPGDLGWFSMRGVEATADALRAWFRQGRLVALGLLDGPDGLLRLALDPEACQDEEVARQVCVDISTPGRGVVPDGVAIVEARGADAIQQRLVSQGWQLDEPWTPLHYDLSEPVPDSLMKGAGLRVEVIGPDRADQWMEVHWSAFKSTPLSDERRRDIAGWWLTMMRGPFADRGRSLALLDPQGQAVAITGVWSAGRGRPGLVEPMGVHQDHRGQGYGAAACEAAAAALQGMGSSSALVCAESANVGAVAAYTAGGFTAHSPVSDLTRPTTYPRTNRSAP